MNKTVTENDSGSEAETVKPFMKIDEEMLKKLSQEISQQVKRNLNVNEQKIVEHEAKSKARNDLNLNQTNLNFDIPSSKSKDQTVKNDKSDNDDDSDKTLNDGNNSSGRQNPRRGKMLNMEMKFIQEGGTLSDLAASTDWLKKIPAASSKSSTDSLEEKVKSDPSLNVYTDVEGNLHPMSELTDLLNGLKKIIGSSDEAKEVEIVTPVMAEDTTTTTFSTSTTTPQRTHSDNRT